jgi:sn-glycerol 3-phosphate transport system permease protein
LERKVVFKGRALPLLLLAPQLLITIVFFFWPAGQAVWFAFLRQDAFGIRTTFVGFENFQDLLADPLYLETIRNTVVFSTGVTVIALATALLLAVLVDRQIRGAGGYRTLLIWPYAIAPAVAAVLWIFLFHPQIGLIGRALNNAGLGWDYKLNGNQAMLMVILASAWKQVSYNFIFFLAGCRASRNRCWKPRRSTAPGRSGASGPSSSRCSRRSPSSCWWSTWSTPSSTPSGSSTH